MYPLNYSITGKISRKALLTSLAVILALFGVMVAVSARSTWPGSYEFSQKVFHVTVQEWGFNQADGAVPMVVNTQDRVTLFIRNTGELTHWIALTQVVGTELNAHRIDPGFTTKLEFAASVPGEFYLTCTIPEHLQQGMKTPFTVQYPQAKT
jgi:uncharacterized cupredoxin-like copper-binding protein